MSEEQEPTVSSTSTDVPPQVLRLNEDDWFYLQMQIEPWKSWRNDIREQICEVFGISKEDLGVVR